MSQNTSTTQKIQLVHIDTPKDKILNFLKKHKNEKFSQPKIAESTGLSTATISRTIGDMVGKTYKRYTIQKDEKGYYALHQDKNGNITNQFESHTDDIRIQFFANKIAKKYIWHKEKASIVNKLVILYEINKRYRGIVQPVLYEMCGKNIIDIVPCSKGIYIILKNTYNIDKIKKDIFQLYETAVKLSK